MMTDPRSSIFPVSSSDVVNLARALYKTVGPSTALQTDESITPKTSEWRNSQRNLVCSKHSTLRYKCTEV